LLLVDFVNPLEFHGAAALAPAAIAAARAAARLRRRLPDARVVFANDHYGHWRRSFPELWQRCADDAGAAGTIARLLRPRRRDFTILKPRHSAFFATPLELLLDELKCRRVIVTGLAADSCVLFSAADAYLRGYSVWVPQDCVAAESPARLRHALDHMRTILKADITPAEGR
jgi:nicotinamidase-related amidase